MSQRAATIQEFADWNGISTRRVWREIKDGLPCDRPGTRGKAVTIYTAEAQQWLAFKDISRKMPEVGSNSIAAARLRLLNEQADREALDNARRRGEVILYTDAEGCFLSVATILAGRLDGVAGRLANELVNEPNAAVIRDSLLTEHRAIRASVAAGLQAFVDKCRQEVGTIRAGYR
jgi:phage terminase Nu1 subunit (DNA packaging protein)